MEYNAKTMIDDLENSLVQPTREPGWDDHIIDSIACNWLNQTSNSKNPALLSNLLSWRPLDYDHKTKLWFAGIFPARDSSTKYYSKTLMQGKEMTDLILVIKIF